MGRTINGKTTTLALIGDPVGHSLSPQMHNYACELLGLNYVYVAYTVKEDGVPAAFDAMRALGIRGSPLLRMSTSARKPPRSSAHATPSSTMAACSQDTLQTAKAMSTCSATKAQKSRAKK